MHSLTPHPRRFSYISDAIYPCLSVWGGEENVERKRERRWDGQRVGEDDRVKEEEIDLHEGVIIQHAL